MRFARKIRVIALAAFLLTTSSGAASAREIPTLTWERGKVQSVVLGGYVDNLNWDVLLEGEGLEPFSFRKSSKNDAGFYVYSISLPRDIKLGQYEVVARGMADESSVMAGVNVIDRFQYNIAEIPRDLLFILLGLIFVGSMQLTLRTWIRREISEAELLDANFSNLGSQSSIKSATISFMEQRVRWKEKWIGRDYLLCDQRVNNLTFLAIAPLISLVTSLFFGVEQSLFPLNSNFAVWVFTLLALVSLLDRYSAKLAILGMTSGFLIFNETLNFPTLLSFAAFLLCLFLPVYVGDLCREFSLREISRSSSQRHFADALGSLGVGISVFWTYLLSESLRFSDSTDASKVTLTSIVLAFGYLYRCQALYSSRALKGSSDVEQLKVRPVVSLPMAMGVLLASISVIFVWTANSLTSIASSILLSCGVITIHLAPKRRLWKSWIFLSRGWIQLLAVTIPTLTAFTSISGQPLVIQDRSELILVISGLPLFLVSLVKLFSTIPNHAPDRFPNVAKSNRPNVSGFSTDFRGKE